MGNDKLIAKVKEMHWEIWLHRRFPPFVTYLMMKHATPSGFEKQGLDGQFPFALYDTDDWYGTPEMFSVAGAEAEKFFKQKSIFLLTQQCEDVLARGRRELPKLCESTESPRAVFEKALALIEPANLYIWIAHAGEAYYLPTVREALRPHIPLEDLEKFIGDVSFPSKKNALAQMEADTRAGVSTEELHTKYAWLKSRGGFQPGYSLEEIAEIQEKTLQKTQEHHLHPDIPDGLEDLIIEVQELVYLRTLRTDALYEMYHLAQPVFKRFAAEIGVADLKDYISDELLSGIVNPVSHEYAILKEDEQVVVVRESIVSKKEVAVSEVKGIVAYTGKVCGPVKVVLVPSESSKVEVGDILVSNMTTPAFVSAMHRAAAFVTNEGGITCHAAILARELKKPCITGTKNATKAFKDGDMVEVDAERGVVRLLS
jgi:phosphoenolpyruvate synthase/pyruvate phosphate dikinase